MEILSTGETAELMTNLEVMQVLSSLSPHSSQRRKKRKHARHCDWIQDKVYAYLEKTPCAQVQSASQMPTLVSELKTKFGLTNAETLQIINFMPQESVEIHLIIQDLPSRLTEERQEELLTLIASYRKQPNNDCASMNGGDEKISGDNELPDIVENGFNGSLLDDIPEVAMKIEPP